MSFNKITVLGNLTRNPELRYTPQGTPVCTLNVASNERERDPKTKEYVDRATFFRATAWGAKAEIILYVKRSSPNLEAAVNAGTFRSVELKIPEGSFLAARMPAAVRRQYRDDAARHRHGAEGLRAIRP